MIRKRDGLEHIVGAKEVQTLKVLKHQADGLTEMRDKISAMDVQTDASIKESERLLTELGIDINVSQEGTNERKFTVHEKMDLRSWDEILSEAEVAVDDNISFSDILTPEEIDAVEKRLGALRADFKSIHKLDKVDWAICGVAGLLASIVDIFLVQMPKHPGMLGSKGHSGGPLSNFIKEKIQGSLSPQEIADLERRNWVPYDAAHSAGLGQKVAGLGTRTHRFQSLGHDPLLGFIFGTMDILKGQFTAIDKYGKLIVQAVDVAGKDTVGMNLFESLARVFGHMKSDIATPAGLPAPLMPLLQFLQVGSIGKSGYTIGEVSRIMYRQGYDFSHFLAMSVPVLLIEVIVRISYFAKRMMEGHSFMDSLPFDTPGNKKPKLQTMLFSAHIMATAANAGKVAVTQNPLSINYPQWLAFFKYGFHQLKWVAYDKEKQMFNHVQQNIDQDWTDIDKMLNTTWNQVNGKEIILA
jgi:hypothetical protein